MAILHETSHMHETCNRGVTVLICQPEERSPDMTLVKT